MTRLFTAIILAFFTINHAFGAVTDLPSKKINGKTYFYYTVKQGDTLYSLSRSFGISTDDIINYNPAVADGLKALSTIYFPADKFKTTSDKPTSDKYILHKVVKGETVYGISKKYGITIEQLIAANPQIADGLKYNTTLHIPSTDGESSATLSNDSSDTTASATNSSKTSDSPIVKTEKSIDSEKTADKEKTEQTQTTATTHETAGGYHTIQSGESLYGIARLYGTSVDAILDINPTLSASSYRAGTLIRIPDNNTQTQSDIAANTPEFRLPEFASTGNNPDNQETEANTSTNSDSTTTEQVGNPIPEKYSIDIAVMLPFDLESAKPGKQALRYTEFYKGFLLAVDSLKNSSMPIRVYAFDINDAATAAGILNREEMENLDVVIGPDSEEILSRLATVCDNKGIVLLNVFNTKSELYSTHTSVVNVNIPTYLMIQNTINEFADRFANSTPIFLFSKNGKRDKNDFIAQLKQTLNKRKIKYKDITFASNLTITDFGEYDKTAKYVIVPASATGAEFDKISSGIKDFRRSLSNTANFDLFGYPEWVTFRGKRLETLHAVSTTIYSRLLINNKSTRRKDVEASFNHWFNAEMEDEIPVQGLLGYDIGSFLIRSMRNNYGQFNALESSTMTGTQSCLSLKQASSGFGYINSAVFFMNYRQNGTINAEVIK